MNCEGKVVWVTGASAGIGAALAQALAGRGARVVLSARRLEQLEEVRAACDRPDEHLVLPLDVTVDDPGQAVAAVLERYGRIDVLINNAGVSQRSRVAETSLAVDRRIMEVNFFAVVALSKAVLPVMQRQQSGCFVVISSLVGHVSTPLRSTYAASKHALHGFFEALRAEEYGNGIGVLMVCPGAIATDVSVNALAGDGSVHGLMDPLQARGMPPAECARRILDALEAGHAEVVVAGREGLVITLNRFAPGLFRRLLRRMKVT